MRVPSIMLHISPTPLVVVLTSDNVSVSNTTKKPDTGPSAYVEIIAGVSEKSIFKNEGRIGMLNSRSRKTEETATMIAVTARNLALDTVKVFIIIFLSHPDYTVGIGIAPIRHRIKIYDVCGLYHR